MKYKTKFILAIFITAFLVLVVFLTYTKYKDRLWKFNTVSGVSDIFCSSSKIYGLTDDGTVYALNPYNGTKLWARRVNIGPGNILPYGGNIIISGHGASASIGDIYSISQNSGRSIWKKRFTPSPYKSIVNFKGTILYVLNDRITAINPLNGYKKWTYISDNTTNADITAAVSGIYYNSKNLLLITKKGEIGWKKNLINAASDISIYSGVYNKTPYIVWFLEDENYMLTLNGATGKVLWSLGNIDGLAPLIANNGCLYVNTKGGSIGCYDLLNGNRRWSSHVGSYSTCIPFLDKSGYLFVGLNTDSVVQLDAKSGAILNEYPLDFTVNSLFSTKVTVISEDNLGHLIIGSDDGYVYAFHL